ncbi:Copper radical oxidase [Mycena kentingensis (nom. inval.)]|nr:Copper radical oxidase [Mycena kentingensis (nom. inval.)]
MLSLLVFSLVLLSPSALAANESAWNGHTTPKSTVPASFTPYYVPPGARAYDSSSPLVHYSEGWTEVFSTAHVGNSFRETRRLGSYLLFSFYGTGIEWFAPCDQHQGIAAVEMDGKPVRTVNTACDSSRRLPQQRVFWLFNLPCKRHTIKAVNSAVPAGASQAIIALDAFVVNLCSEPPPALAASPSPPTSNLEASAPPAMLQAASWSLEQKGSTGVHAMQLVVVSPTHALIIDKVEHNPLTIDGHPAWAALYNLNDHSVIPLALQSNSFCAGGTFLSNGTLINVGGNPVVEDRTAAADFGDVDGLQSIRIFEPCLSPSASGCSIYENHQRVRMASPRWYNTVLRIYDGSAMIIGGSKKGGWINNATTNNPTFEFYPPKNIHGSKGLPLGMAFLQQTLNANLFPIAFALPDGTIFLAANTQATIFDWTTHSERALPAIPNGVRVSYPMAATAVLLPLSSHNNYEPEVLICGGSTISDKKAGYEISSQDRASAQCARMTLTDAGIAKGWEVESMPEARLMPDAVLLPTGQVLLVNGAGSGISGYANVHDPVGQSNADHPVLTPVLYDPTSLQGSRFSRAGMPTSNIPRMYHSVATLTPRGDVMIAGSNPNLDRSEVKYGTEYRVEWLRPPYMSMQRPKIVDGPKILGFKETAKLSLHIPPGDSPDIKVALMDFGFVTHAVHANSRLVYLDHTLSGNELSVVGPPDGKVYPPGPGWVFVLVDGVPSEALHVMIGDGKGPKVDEEAMRNVFENTKADQYDKVKSGAEE